MTALRLAGQNFEAIAEATRRLDPVLRPRRKEFVLALMGRDRDMTAAHLAVGMAILAALYWNEGSARISRGDLEAITGRARSSVQRAIRKLEERGIIVVDRKRISRKRHETNRYAFPSLPEQREEIGSTLAQKDL